MTWQLELADEIRARLPAPAQAHVIGSVADPSTLDDWSDLDLEIDLAGAGRPVDVFAGWPIWAATDDRSAESQVVRAVFDDGRRLDLRVTGGEVRLPDRAEDNDVRMLAALAAAKLGRGDHLIGLHLTLEILRECLVLAMCLRDRDLGTTTHRFGSERDALAQEVTALLHDPLGVVPRPNVVERAVAIYGRWRRQLVPGYEPAWSGLRALIDRGLRA